MRNRRIATAALASGMVLASMGLVTTGTASAGGDHTNVMIKARHSGLCVEVVDGSIQHGADVRQGNCTGADHQRWDINRIGHDQYEIVNRKSQLCLDVEFAHTHQGANVLQARCERRTNQRWWQEDKDSGYVMFHPTHTGNRCLDVKDAQKFHGTDVIQSGCHGRENQQFLPTSV